MAWNEKSLKELHELLMQPSVQSILQKAQGEDRQIVARNLRNDVQADWLDSFFNRMSQESTASRINKETGKPHTVESMVEEYKEKIGLKSIISQPAEEKLTSVADFDIPLSKKQANDFLKKKELTDLDRSAVWDDILQHISAHLSSHRGYADTPAIVYELRDTFGQGLIEEFGDKLIKEIIKQKGQYDVGDVHSRLPKAPTGQPQKVDLGIREDNEMFKTMKDSV